MELLLSNQAMKKDRNIDLNQLNTFRFGLIQPFMLTFSCISASRLDFTWLGLTATRKKSVWPLTFKRTPNWADETKHSLLRGRSPAPGCPAGCAHSPHSPQSASHRCSCWCRSIRMFRLPRWRYRPPSEGICKHVEHAENSGATERWKWLNIIQY